MSTRRTFLTRTTSMGVLYLGSSAPLLWQRAAASAEPKRGLPILVVIELSGGNDGLNTVVPYADDLYAKARPSLRIEQKAVLKLNDHVGLNPALKELHKLWETGDLTVIQGAGYPNPNRSHTRSMEIWQTGHVGPVPDAGWLGRAADLHPAIRGCYVGAEATPLAVTGRKAMTSAIVSLADMRLPSNVEVSQDPAWPSDALAHEIERRRHVAIIEAKKLEAIAATTPGQDDSPLGERLRTIRVLIEHDPGIRVFYITTAPSSFDTHADQVYTHRQALRTVSSSVGRFLAELHKNKLDERVIILMFSEFGRRVKENAQHGTDHGTAGPVLIAGTPVRGGLIGPAPDLANLDHGDLRYAIDFRDIYATLLKRWLDVDPTPILGQRNDGLAIF